MFAFLKRCLLCQKGKLLVGFGAISILGGASSVAYAASTYQSQRSDSFNHIVQYGNVSGTLTMFFQCLQAHGLPDLFGIGTSMPKGFNPASSQAIAAGKACYTEMPLTNSNSITGPNISFNELFAQCMREMGISNFPNPNIDGSFSFSSNPPSFNQIQGPEQVCTQRVESQ
jgi:hypothetical protein